MAKANAKVETRITGVTLELSPIEAYVLNAVLLQIGGDPNESLRVFTDGIIRALDEAVPVVNRDRNSPDFYTPFGADIAGSMVESKIGFSSFKYFKRDDALEYFIDTAAKSVK